MKKITALIIYIVLHTCLWGAYLKNVPITITQPNGTIIACFATGDEYYNWAHDENGYTIIQDSMTGYYCYAILDGVELIASQYVVGTISPETVNLQPYVNLPPEKIRDLLENNPMYITNELSVVCKLFKGMLSDANQEEDSDEYKRSVFNAIKDMLSDTIKSDFISEMIKEVLSAYQLNIEMFSDTIINISSDTIGFNTNVLPPPVLKTLNNIVVYIRFADQPAFSTNQSTYTTMFNNTSSGANSMRNYFKEVSYNQLDVVSHFYPTNNGTIILSYQDAYARSHYCPYSVTNPDGYTGGNDGAERKNREHTLLYNAINYIRNQVSTSLNIDYNNDGEVDNVCFIVQGGTTAWSTLLWPHRWSLHSKNISINEKRVYDYNFQLENHTLFHGNGVLCHEMYHTLGAPDLYHYQDNYVPVGIWDLMEKNLDPPQHMCAHMKSRYGRWISPFIPEIRTSGTYTLQPLTSSTNNCYSIRIKGLQYFVFEYRKKTGTFESSLPGSGLIIYRTNYGYVGNSQGLGPGGKYDEVYVFRRNGTPNNDGYVSEANFSQTSGRTVFSNSTNPYCFTVNGNYGNIYIKNIRENTDGTLSFDVRFCDGDDIIPKVFPHGLINAFNSIKTLGTVIVLNTGNVIFEAGNEVILNSGFEVQLGGTFEINMNECGEK